MSKKGDKSEERQRDRLRATGEGQEGWLPLWWVAVRSGCVIVRRKCEEK